MTPPISRDALIHHLAIPKLWIRNGGFYAIPWAEYSYYPMYINLIYLVCLYFNNDIAPKLIHLSFGLATGISIYLYLKEKYNNNWGLLGMIIFITTPIIIWLSTAVYVDLGMTFFTTSSVLLWIKWRDDNYNQFKWFFLSAVCMGFAVGSKYNALIALMIVNLLLVFIYVQDKNDQIASVRYGLFFFIITAIAASPWYLKNYYFTGNPFYPLFNSIFDSLHHLVIQNWGECQAPVKSTSIGLFQKRELLYDETLWQTFLIPIRMFFQGNDYGYRHFQGVLNPILIVFSPFILIKNKNSKDIFIFISFTAIFIFIAFFLTDQQVRYFLPVLPFLSIIAVIGIKNLIDWSNRENSLLVFKKHTLRVMVFRNIIFLTIIILLSFNFNYLKNRWAIINPFPYISGKETKNAFLKRHLSYFPTVEYINANLPDDAVVLTMLLGRRGYYLDRCYKNESSFGMKILNCMVNFANDEERFNIYVKSLNVTHLMMKTDLVNKYLNDNFSKQNIMTFINRVKQNWELVYQEKQYAVFEL